MQEIVLFHNTGTRIRCLALCFESGYVAFRIHRNVFSNSSTVLADMPSSPAVSDESDREALEGCPVVQVAETVHDVKHLIRIRYNGIE